MTGSARVAQAPLNLVALTPTETPTREFSDAALDHPLHGFVVPHLSSRVRLSPMSAERVDSSGFRIGTVRSHERSSGNLLEGMRNWRTLGSSRLTHCPR